MAKTKKNSATEAEVKGGQIVETVKPPFEQAKDEKVEIKRGRVDSLTIYEVREDELVVIGKGSSTSIFLNFSIFLLTTSISFLIALLTGNYENKIILFTIFFVITSVGFIIGIILMILWLRQKDDFKDAIRAIRKRMK